MKESKFSLTEVEKYEVWDLFKHQKLERSEELDELIEEAVKWLKKSKEAEQELAKNDLNAEEKFAKLHRVKHSQVTVSAICGCGRSVQSKKSFEKINYSSTTERKLRNILGTIRIQLRDNVALTKARAAEAVSSLRYKVELKSHEQLEMGRFWVWLNTLVYHAFYLESVGLAESLQFWITGLVKQHRLEFTFNDELRLLDLFLSLPPGCLSRWASKVLKIYFPGVGLNAEKETLFYVETAISSVTDRLVTDEDVKSETGQTRLDDRSEPSPSSSDFSLISDTELMGGMERDENARVAMLTPNDLNSVILQLNLSKLCTDLNERTGAKNLPHFTTHVIELLSFSIKVHSYSTLFQSSIQILSNEMVKLLKIQFAASGPADEPISEIVLRYLSISRLGILSNMLKLPFEQIVDVVPFVGHFFFLPPDNRNAIDESAFKFTESKIATLSHLDLIHYLKSVASFIQKTKSVDLHHVIPLFSLLYRICMKLPATMNQINDAIRLDIFRITLASHASLISTLLMFISECMADHGEANILLIKGINLQHWVPAQHDISLLQDWLLNEPHQSPASRIGQTVIANINWGTDSNHLPCVPLVMHQKAANIIVRQTLKIILPENVNIVTKTQDTLGFNMAKTDHLRFLHNLMGRFLINPLFWKFGCGSEIDLQFQDSEMIDAHSNPLLGPAVIHSGNATCAYLLTMMLDSEDIEVNDRIEKIVDTGLTCIKNTWSSFLTVRCLEVLFKIAVSDRERDTIKDDSLVKVARLLDKMLVSCETEITDLFCSLVNESPHLPVVFIKIIFLTSDWTRIPLLNLLENCLCYSWLQLSRAKTHTLEDEYYNNFQKIEETFRISVLNYLHERRNNINKARASNGSRWQSITSALTKAMKPAHDDLVIQFPANAPVIVRFQYYRSLDIILMTHPDWCIQKSIKEIIFHNQAVPLNQVFDESATAFNISSQYTSLPIYKLGQMLLDTRFDSPILLLLSFQFFRCFLEEFNGISLGHKYYDKHPHIDFLSKLGHRLVEFSEFFTDTSAQGPACFSNTNTIASLFWTAALWLEEPRVHDTQEELQYLPPQYGPSLLVQIRSNIFGDWLKLSNFGFEQKIMKNKAEWDGQFKTVERAFNFSYFEGTENGIEEDVQQLYIDKEVVSMGDRTEMPGIDFLLNCDLRMFCSSLIAEVISAADWQLCCAEQLTQLDLAYCDLLPDLYKNLPQVIEVEAACSSGFRGHTCPSPAKVPVEVEIRTKMNEISNILAVNRQKYLEIRTNWINPNRWVNLGTSSFKLAHVADLLLETFQTSLLEEERALAQKQGEAMFYAIVGSVSPSVTSFSPCARISIGLIEKLATVFCAETAPFQRLDTCIRFPSLAPILAPHFEPQADSEDFVQMYSLVIDRLNKGHTTLAFSLLSKFKVYLFAEKCTEIQMQEMIFSLKSGFFALSGDKYGETNLEFDLPDSSDSADLVKEIIAKQTCDIIRVRPEESAREIIQTLLQITSLGDGYISVWEKISNAFQDLKDAQLECSEDLVNMISNHFATIRHNEDIFSGPTWPSVLPYIAGIMTTTLNMKQQFEHSTGDEIKNMAESSFIAVEPFLKPFHKNGKLVWPESAQTQLFFDVLFERFKTLNRFDPASTQRNFCAFLLELAVGDASAVTMPQNYFSKLLDLVEKMNISELVPTCNLISNFEKIFSYNSAKLHEMIAHIIIRSDWAMLFSLQPSFSSMPTLLKCIQFIAGEHFPIQKVEPTNETLINWMHFDLTDLSNDDLAKIFVDFTTNLNIESFIHPSSCHRVALDLIQEICLHGKGNTIEEDLLRRRIWVGALARLLRRHNIEFLSDVMKSRITSFLTEQLMWISTGVTDDVSEETLIPIWGDLFQILNSNAVFLKYFVAALQDESKLSNIRLFISTSSRMLREPISQLAIIESAIEKSFDLGHGLSFLHGTLCSLPVYLRNDFHNCLTQSESLLCPLLLLQEQLRPTLPMPSNVKILQQNTHLISNTQMSDKFSEWKLVIYLHQMIRLTMSFWKDCDSNSFGLLQVFLHNELKPILNNFFDQKSSSMFFSIVGFKTKIHSPTFQILIKAFILLITNLCNEKVDLNELQIFADLPVTDSRFKNYADFVYHLENLIEFNSINSIDEMVRVWSRVNDEKYSMFYLDNP